MKRAFDIVASGLGLIVLSPIFLILAIWILRVRYSIARYELGETTRISASLSFVLCELGATKAVW